MAKIFLTQLANPAQTVTYANIVGVTVSASRAMDVRVVTPDTPGTYPVVFYSHGHSANPGTAGNTNARALADQGYIVVVPTHLDSSANLAALRDAYPVSNPASTLHRVADIKFAFDNLQRLMAPATGYVADTSRPVMAGHSHGSWVTYLLTGAIPGDPAYTALPSGNPYGLTSLVDTRFVASMLLSPQSITDVNAVGPGFGGNSWADYRMPSLFVSGTLDTTVLEPDFAARFDGFDFGPGEDKHAIVLNGADHFDIGGLSATPSETNAIAGVMDAFLDAYARGQPNRITSPQALIGLDALITQAFVRDGGLSRGLVKGADASDLLTGHVTDDDVRALGGNDVITGARGNDTLDGGVGRDTAVYAGPRASYTVTATTITDQTPNRDGADIVASIERLRFADGTLALDIALPGQGESNAGSAFRLYEAAFNRAPDLPGLAFWIKAMDGGMSALQAAQGFVASQEFRNVYGADPTAQQLVTGFYTNILGRAPEAAGYDFWFNILNGRPDQRAMVLEGIANSPENQNGLIGTIGQGIWLPGDLLA